MKIVVVCEPTLGRTAGVAAAVAAGARSAGAEVILGGPATVSVLDLQQADLVVLGVASLPSRIVGEGNRGIDEGGVRRAQPALERWLDQLDVPVGVAAAFDTRTTSRPLDAAARWIEQRLRQRGFRVAARRSFLLDRSDGPLRLRELVEARAWGRGLVERVRARAERRDESAAGGPRFRLEVGRSPRRRALVVDPDPDVCARAVSLLTARGYRVRTRAEPAEPLAGPGGCETDGSDLVEADLIVLRFDRTGRRSAAASLLERSLAAQRMVIVVADGDDPVHRCHDPRVLTVRPADRLELVSAIGRFDATGGREPAVGTPEA